jgi:hypothetical protein
MESDLTTFRRCPDCGWRIDFTKEQIDALRLLTRLVVTLDMRLQAIEDRR